MGPFERRPSPLSWAKRSTLSWNLLVFLGVMSICKMVSSCGTCEQASHFSGTMAPSGQGIDRTRGVDGIFQVLIWEATCSVHPGLALFSRTQLVVNCELFS